MDGNTREAFGAKLPENQVRHWKAMSGRDRVIHQAELLPIAIALNNWKHELKGRRVLLFIDNDAARYSMIKGTSHNPAADEILQQNWELVMEWEISIWAERVPSKANPADGPSRDDWIWCYQNYVKKVTPNMG